MRHIQLDGHCGHGDSRQQQSRRVLHAAGGAGTKELMLNKLQTKVLLTCCRERLAA